MAPVTPPVPTPMGEGIPRFQWQYDALIKASLVVFLRVYWLLLL